MTAMSKATGGRHLRPLAHVPAVGDVILFGAITGMPEINGLLGIVQATPTPTATELHGRH
jgi:hypothetical protein